MAAARAKAPGLDPAPKAPNVGGRPTNAEKARKTVDSAVIMAALSFAPMLPGDSAVVLEFRESLVDSVMQVANEHPSVMKFLADTKGMTSWLGLLMVTAQMGGAIATAHGRLPEELGYALVPEQSRDRLRAAAERQRAQRTPPPPPPEPAAAAPGPIDLTGR